MVKTANIGFRVDPAVKEAAERAAAADRRKLSSWIEKLMIEELERLGLLEPPAVLREVKNG